MSTDNIQICQYSNRFNFVHFFKGFKPGKVFMLLLRKYWWALLILFAIIMAVVFWPKPEAPAVVQSVKSQRTAISAAQKAVDVAARIAVLEDKRDSLEKGSGDNGKLEELIRVNEQLLELYSERTGLMIADAKIERSAKAIKDLNMVLVGCAKDVKCMEAAKAKADAARDALNNAQPAPSALAPVAAPAAPAPVKPIAAPAPPPAIAKPASAPAQVVIAPAPASKPAQVAIVSQQVAAPAFAVSAPGGVSTQQCVQMPTGFACAKNQAALGYRECGCS
jgi:hypothetical protein